MQVCKHASYLWSASETCCKEKKPEVRNLYDSVSWQFKNKANVKKISNTKELKDFYLKNIKHLTWSVLL